MKLGYVSPDSGCWNYSSGCVMLHELTDGCRTTVVVVSGIKTVVTRDAELLLTNMAMPIRIGDYFASGMVTCLRKHCQ